MKAEIEKLTIKLPTRTIEFTAEEYEALKAHFEEQRVLPLKEYIPCPYPVYPQPQPYILFRGGVRPAASGTT